MTPLLQLAISLLGLGGVAALAKGPVDLLSLTGAAAVILVVFPVLLLAEVAYLAFAHRGKLSRAYKLRCSCLW